jgi:hypothetical protein
MPQNEDYKVSEYSSPHSKNEAPIEATIFDDDIIDHMAAQVGSVDEARRQLGIEAPKEPDPGAFVTLAARAAAVSGIMEGINRENIASGATQQAEIEDSDFRRRYENPENVAEILRSNAAAYVERRLDIVNATKAMIDEGFDPKEVDTYKDAVRNDEKRRFEGVGPENIARRQEEVKRIQRTADISKL